MNRTLAMIAKPLNAMLAQANKRLAAIVTIACFNVIAVIWMGINIHQANETKKEYFSLQQANQTTLEQLAIQENKQQELEKEIKKRLANRENLNGLILSLESTAPALGVTLSDANQTYVEASRDKLPHSIIEYNVQGSYANVLQFVAESLNKHDALVLKNLSFRRADPLVSNLQINLEWAFYYP